MSGIPIVQYWPIRALLAFSVRTSGCHTIVSCFGFLFMLAFMVSRLDLHVGLLQEDIRPLCSSMKLNVFLFVQSLALLKMCSALTSPNCPNRNFTVASSGLCFHVTPPGPQDEAIRTCYHQHDRYSLTLWQLKDNDAPLFHDVVQKLIEMDINQVWLEAELLYEGGFYHYSYPGNELYNSPVFGLNFSQDATFPSKGKTCVILDVSTMTHHKERCSPMTEEEGYFPAVCLSQFDVPRMEQGVCPPNFKVAPRVGPYCLNVTVLDTPKWSWGFAAEECQGMGAGTHIVQRAFPGLYLSGGDTMDVQCPLGIQRSLESTEEDGLYLWVNGTEQYGPQQLVEAVYRRNQDRMAAGEESLVGAVSMYSRGQYLEHGGTQWRLTGLDDVFRCLACEMPLPEVLVPRLQLTFGQSSDLLLLVENPESLMESTDWRWSVDRLTSRSVPRIRCFTDAETFYPTEVILKGTQSSRSHYFISPVGNGHYWCVGHDLFTTEPIITGKLLVPGVNIIAVLLEFVDSNKDSLCMKFKVFRELKKLQHLLRSRINLTRRKSIMQLHLIGEKAFADKLAKALAPGSTGAKLERFSSDCSHVLIHATAPKAMDIVIGAETSIDAFKFKVVYVRNTQSCDEEVTNHSWPATPTGVVVELPTPGGGHVTRKCEGDFSIGSYWGNEETIESILQNPGTSMLGTDRSLTSSTTTVQTSSTMITVTSVGDTFYDMEGNPTELEALTYSGDGVETKEPSKIPTELHPTTSTLYIPHSSEDLFFTSTILIPSPTPKNLSPTSINYNTTEILRSADTLHELSQEGQVTMSNLTEAVGILNGLLDEDFKVLVETRASDSRNVLRDMENIMNRVVLENETFTLVRDKLAVFISDLNVGEMVGLILTDRNPSQSDDNISGEMIPVMSMVPMKSHITHGRSIDVEIVLPELKHSLRLSVAVFSDGMAFEEDGHANGSLEGDVTVNSRVVSINLDPTHDSSDWDSNQYVEIKFKPFDNLMDNGSLKLCAYWEFKTSGYGGRWSTDGCEMLNATSEGLDVCRCNHLTHFAEIITGRNYKLSEAHQIALDVISAVGCTLSILGFLGIAATSLIFPQWREQLGNQLLLSLSTAVTLNMAMFLVVAFGVAGDIGSMTCIIVGAMLHYSMLASFCWMLICAGLQYIRLVRIVGVQHTPHLLLKASVIAWGIPAFPLVVVLCIDPHLYTKEIGFSEERNFCFPIGASFYWTVLGPIVLVVAVNLVVFVAILANIFDCCAKGTLRKHGPSSKRLVMRRLIMGLLLFFLFGLTWVFGFLARNLLFTYLFCITATLQGFVLFLFFIVGERRAREKWFPGRGTMSSSTAAASRDVATGSTTGNFSTSEERTPLRNDIPLSQRVRQSEW
uniref:Uncharacterized protein n=1 Tax=Timema poppense TaxID=170557 RepID=A0A7R9GVS2_TIMPO|nr:unnamed protein product [Timema poppensis]